MSVVFENCKFEEGFGVPVQRQGRIRKVKVDEGLVQVRVSKNRGRSVKLFIAREDVDALTGTDLDQYREEVAQINGKRASMQAAIVAALHELGEPQPEYPAPVANAVAILRRALDQGHIRKRRTGPPTPEGG